MQGIGQMLGQPATALSQGLRVGQHFGDSAERPTPQQSVLNRKHQSPADTKLRMRPQGIEGRCHPPLNRILNRDNGCLALPPSELFHNRSKPNAGHQLNILESVLFDQHPGGLLAIGPGWAKACGWESTSVTLLRDPLPSKAC